VRIQFHSALLPSPTRQEINVSNAAINVTCKTRDAGYYWSNEDFDSTPPFKNIMFQLGIDVSFLEMTGSCNGSETFP